MNRGTLTGFGHPIGDYNPLPSGGTQAGRGRLQVDEIRLWGHPDNVAQPPAASVGPWPGAARFYNTNPQAKVGNLFYSGDQGVVVNVLNGPIQSGSSFPPFEAAYNTAGQVVFGPGAGLAQMFGFVTNTQMKNIPGVSANVPSFDFSSSNCLFTADGATATQSAFNDYSSSPAFQVINSGTFTQGGLTNYVAGGGTGGTGGGAGLTMTSRTGFLVNNFNIQSGVLTNQYGIDIGTLVAGATNVGVRVYSGNATIAATTPGTCIQVMPGTTTYSAGSNVTIPPTLQFSGTHVLQGSANVFGMGNGFLFQPIFKNDPGFTANMGPFTTVFASPTFTADTKTGLTLGTQTMFQGSCIVNIANAGTFVSGTIQNFISSGTNIGAGVTITSLTHYKVSAPTVSGTVTTQVGLDMASMSQANVTTGIGIRLAAMNSPLQLAMATTGPDTGNLTSNTNGVMTLYHGATNYYWLIAFNDAGTVRYKYLQLNGTGVTWVTGTTLPT